MTHQDWYKVLDILDKRRWSLSYDRYLLDQEDEIHSNAIKIVDKELIEAKYSKGVNP